MLVKMYIGDGDNFYREFIRDYILVYYLTMSLEVLDRVTECTNVCTYMVFPQRWRRYRVVNKSRCAWGVWV